MESEPLFEPDEQIVRDRRRFVKLHRRLTAATRKGVLLDTPTHLEILYLDGRLSLNDPTWNRNFPESANMEAIEEALSYYQDGGGDDAA